MDPQRLNDLAERFALIIEGLCKAISAPQGRFGGWLLFFIPNRFRLIGQELTEFAALLRSGKLFVLAPSRTRTAGFGEASPSPSCSDLASAGPARSRASGGQWLAGQEEPGEGVVVWRLSDVPVVERQDAGADRGPHGAEFAPASPRDAGRAESRRAPDEACQSTRLAWELAARAPSPGSHPAFGRVVHAYGGSSSGHHAPVLARAAAPLHARRAQFYVPPPDPAFFTTLSATRLSTP